MPLPAAVLLVTAALAGGSRFAPPPGAFRPDTLHVGAAADTSDAESGPRLVFGGGLGELSYPDGYRERLVMLGARLRLLPGVSVSAHPGFGSATGLTTTTGATGIRRRRRSIATGATTRSRTVSGFTDLPVSLDGEHEFDALPWTPTLSVGYGVLLPTGNATSGVGAGEIGGSLDLGLGVTPVEHVGIDLGAGRYRSGSAWALGSGGTWGSAGASVEVARPLTLSLGVSGDLGSAAQASQGNVANGRTVDGSATLHLRGVPPFTLDAHHAYAGTAPRWSVGLEIGGVGLPLTTLGRLGR